MGNTVAVAFSIQVYAMISRNISPWSYDITRLHGGAIDEWPRYGFYFICPYKFAPWFQKIYLHEVMT